MVAEARRVMLRKAPNLWGRSCPRRATGHEGMTKKELVSMRSTSMHRTDGVIWGCSIFPEIPIMDWEPLVERPCHLVRKEKVIPESSTKVNDWLATIPVTLGSLDALL
jgi:hypothetical protein